MRAAESAIRSELKLISLPEVKALPQASDDDGAHDDQPDFEFDEVHGEYSR